MGPRTVSDGEIEAFLRRFCAAIDLYGLTLWRNTKNDTFLLDNGFTNADVEDAVRGLRARDHRAGPMADDKEWRASQTPGDVWVFHREFEGFAMYVKLKFDPSGRVPTAECMSFHEREKP